MIRLFRRGEISVCETHQRMAADGACGQTLHRGSYLPESAVKMISAIAPWVKPNGRKELCKRLTGVNHSGLVATMYRACGINKWMTGYGKELLPDIPIEWHTHTHTVGLLQRRSVIVLLSTAQLAKWGKAMLPSGAIGHIAVTGNTAVWLDVLKKNSHDESRQTHMQHLPALPFQLNFISPHGAL